MNTQPLWNLGRPKRYPPLTKSAGFDVVVIGGGITGVTTAYLLKQEGRKVCLLERDRLGFVDTGLTTAHLTYVTDLRPAELLSKFGAAAAGLVWEAGAAAIEKMAWLVKNLAIDCDFRRVPGFLYASSAADKKERRAIERDAEAAEKIGFPAAFVESAPYFASPAVRFPNQAKFHPLKYLAAIAAAIPGDGSAIYEHAEVKEIRNEPLRVTVGRHELSAEHVVIATHTPLMGKTGLLSAALFQSKLFPYSSYVIGAEIPHGLVPEASFWDTSDPYYYLRIERGTQHDYAIFGGEDHKTGQADDTQECFDRLRQKLSTVIPQAKPDRQWSGQVIETNDGLPYIGETAENQFVGTGFSGNGMTFGTVTAMMACDAIAKRDNPWQKLFAVNRKKIRGGTWDYFVENFDYPFYYLKDRMARPEAKTTRSVGRGEGKIISLGGQRVACSRDDDGKVSSVSPYCTHMGCLVHWNDAERTWDCPCHGSRFHADGQVLAGPAETPLEPIRTQAASRKSPKKATRARRRS